MSSTLRAEVLWPDERIKQRADELDGELHNDNTRPWQHYMEVWRTLSFEMRDEYQAKLDAYERELQRRESLPQEATA